MQTAFGVHKSFEEVDVYLVSKGFLPVLPIDLKPLEERKTGGWGRYERGEETAFLFIDASIKPHRITITCDPVQLAAEIWESFGCGYSVAA